MACRSHGCTERVRTGAPFVLSPGPVLESSRGCSRKYWLSTAGYSRSIARVLERSAAAVGPGQRVPCAGAYLSGAAGSNVCPAGSMRIVTEAACRIAAVAAGKTAGYPFVETYPTLPRGCYYAYNNIVNLNTAPDGFGDSNYRLLCAVTSTGAPPPRRSAPRVRTDACSGTARESVSHARTHARTLECALPCHTYSRGTRRRLRAVFRTVWC